MVRDLPLVDLPQHALQLANWLRLDAHDAATSAELELNFRTPYFLAYPIARALCGVLPVLTSLKLVFWASVVAQAFTFRKLCERLGHEPWLGLLGYPLGLGYSFCFGFVAFCAAMPLAYLAFAQLYTHRQAPTLRSGACLAATLALLLVAHGVALAFLLAVTAPLLLLGGGKRWQRVLPLLSPPLLGAVWLVPGGSSTRLGGDLWGIELLRWVEVPGQLVGIGAVDHVSTVLGLALLAAAAWQLGKWRGFWLTVPLGLSLVGYGLFPLMFRGAGPLHPRFSSYFVPSLLLAFAPHAEPSPLRSMAGRAAAACVSAAVVLVFVSRLSAFNLETAGLHEIVTQAEPGLNVRPIVFERGGWAFPGTPAHLHLPAYYCVEKGGTPGYSFAMYGISVVRYRPGVRIRMWGGAEWTPQDFSAEREANNYDYFIVKSSSDLTAWLFPGPEPAAHLERHVGDWWSYRRPREPSLALLPR